MELVRIYADPGNPTPGTFAEGLAAVFASLDERPRPVLLALVARNSAGRALHLDFIDGEPVFSFEGAGAARARLRRRYIAEHPVPLAAEASGFFRSVLFLRLSPTTGNRVRVSRPSFPSRVFARLAAWNV